jgi:hypothetical protein
MFGSWRKIRNKRECPVLRPLQRFAELDEYLTNSQSFNMAMRLQVKGFIGQRSNYTCGIHISLMKFVPPLRELKHVVNLSSQDRTDLCGDLLGASVRQETETGNRGGGKPNLLARFRAEAATFLGVKFRPVRRSD